MVASQRPSSILSPLVTMNSYGHQLTTIIYNHNLSLESHSGAPYQLDRSQFERLSVGDPGRFSLPVAQLNIQRRMRPGISRFIKKIYPRLIDHDVTKALPNVVGMRENVSVPSRMSVSIDLVTIPPRSKQTMLTFITRLFGLIMIISKTMSREMISIRSPTAMLGKSK